jgi:hypothetical protein
MNAFDDIKRDNVLFRGFAINLFIIILTLLYILVSFRNLPPYLPLFNQLPWGEQRIAETVWIFAIPFLCFVIFVFNLIYSEITYKKIPLLARIMVVTSFLVSVLAMLFVVRTIQLV